MTAQILPATANARLRPKNQVTLPESVVNQLQAKVGDRFRVTVDGDVVHLHLIRDSYHGALKDLWPPDWMEELRRDRDSWQP